MRRRSKPMVRRRGSLKPANSTEVGPTDAAEYIRDIANGLRALTATRSKELELLDSLLASVAEEAGRLALGSVH